jgi:hypothetical protein
MSETYVYISYYISFASTPFCSIFYFSFLCFLPDFPTFSLSSINSTPKNITYLIHSYICPHVVRISQDWTSLANRYNAANHTVSPVRVYKIFCRVNNCTPHSLEEIVESSGRRIGHGDWATRFHYTHHGSEVIFGYGAEWWFRLWGRSCVAYSIVECGNRRWRCWSASIWWGFECVCWGWVAVNKMRVPKAEP